MHEALFRSSGTTLDILHVESGSTSATEIVFLCTSKPTKSVRSVMVRLVQCLGIGSDHRSNPRQRCYTP